MTGASAGNARKWGSDVASMNMIQAINSGLDVMMQRDPKVLTFGEDAGYFGGVFKATDGLQKKHGLTGFWCQPSKGPL